MTQPDEIDKLLAKYEIGFVTHGKDVNQHLASFKQDIKDYITLHTQGLERLMYQKLQEICEEDDSEFAFKLANALEDKAHQLTNPTEGSE